jgi:hypothetical protein
MSHRTIVPPEANLGRVECESQFFEAMRCVRLQERLRKYSKNNGNWIIGDIFAKFGLNIAHPDSTNPIFKNYYFENDFAFKLYAEHYDMFCDLEKIFFGKTIDEVKKLNKKIKKLTTRVAELEEQLAYAPLGAKYQEAKESFDTLQQMLPK